MKRGIRIGAIVLVFGVFVALAIYNSLNPGPKVTGVWNDAMTIGNKETAKHHFIMYTDIFCPYCDKFSNAVTANWDDFNKKYIEDENILFEIRVTDINYLSGHSNNSLPAAEGAYCAAKQEKFWDYYHAILAKLYEDYHSQGIGVDRTSPRIPDLETDYFTDAANRGGLDYDSFATCMQNHETKDEVEKNTNRATNTISSGVPFFVFDKFSYNGFAGDWDAMEDYKNVELLMKAGLKTK